MAILYFNSALASTLFMPDSDTGLLLSLASNTAQQLTRLEQILSETDKHTKLFRETVDMVEERYEVVESLQAMASNYAQLASSKPSSLAEINDVLEGLNDQKERLREMIKNSKTAEFESNSIKDQSKTIDRVNTSDNTIAKKQISKSFGSGKTFSKNMDRVNAQNTALILKESIALNGSINTTNGLLATQNKLNKIQVDSLIDEGISKNNALSPLQKRYRK